MHIEKVWLAPAYPRKLVRKLVFIMSASKGLLASKHGSIGFSSVKICALQLILKLREKVLCDHGVVFLLFLLQALLLPLLSSLFLVASTQRDQLVKSVVDKLFYLLNLTFPIVGVLLEGRLDDVHVERWPFFYVIRRDYIEPILEDVGLAAEDVGLALFPDPIKRVCDDGDKDVHEDDLCHEHGQAEVEPDYERQRQLRLQVERIHIRFTCHHDQLVYHCAAHLIWQELTVERGFSLVNGQ